MSFANILTQTTIDPLFSGADRTTIENAMRTAYDGSATARKMFDDWIAAGKTITVNKETNDLFAYANTGIIHVGLDFLNDNNYIDNDGKAVEDTPVTGIVHELVHALTGKLDNFGTFDYRGDTVTFSNIIYKELGLPEQNSYISYDAVGNVLTRGFEYTNGAAIDRSVAGDKDLSTWTALISDDLLVGGPSGNKLESGLGDDFLFGGGGDDFLNGGLFGTDTVVFTGKPVDYDIRLNSDGTWTSEHVRGTMDEGTDTLKNLEKVWFAGSGQTFDLVKSGLTYQRDIAFVVDQTGSMGDDIAAVKASATALVNTLFAGDTIDARVGVVGFRDNTIGEPTQVLLPFTDQDVLADRKTSALAAINSLGASGGGDFPETAFDGLLKALNGTMGDWRVGAGTKQVVLFTDATAKDAFLMPTVLGYASDIGAVITSSSSRALGAFGAVDTFELSPSNGAVLGRDPMSESHPLPDYVPSDDPIQPPSGAATVQIYTIFIETFIEPDPNLVDVTESTGGAVLTAANPEEVVARLFEVISSNQPPVLSSDSGSPHAVSELPGITNSSSLDAISGTLAFTDQTADTHTVSAQLVSTAWSGGAVIPASTQAALSGAISTSIGAEGGPAGELVWSFSVEDKNVDFLGVGETLDVVYDLTLLDQLLNSATTQVSIQFTGANDAPIALPDSNGTAKNSTVSVSASGGALNNDTDPDSNDVAGLFVSQVNGVTGNVGHTVAGTYGSLTLNADGSYSYVAKQGSLPSKFVAQDTFNYTVADGHGGTTNSTLSIVVSNPGTNYKAGKSTTLNGGNGPDVLDGSLGHAILLGGNGPDVLIGGDGDTLTGGKGPDIFLFRQNFGATVVTDFDVNTDAIQFDKSLFTSVGDILSHTTNSAGSAVIADSHGDSVTLLGVTLAQLQGHQADFFLA